MVRRGIYFRMLDRNKQMRFRNETQFELRDDCIIFSTSAMVGQAEPTVRLPIAWQDATSFTVNWSRVNEHWSSNAIFRAHREPGAEGLLEQHRHLWRYAGPAAQTSRNNQGSQQASNSSHTPPRPTGAARTDAGVSQAKTGAEPSPSTPLRPRDASTTGVCVPTAQTAAVPTASLAPKSYKTCVDDFDPITGGYGSGTGGYGSGYLRLTTGVQIQDLPPPAPPEGWAYGSLIFTDGRLSEPGWYPPSHAR